MVLATPPTNRFTVNRNALVPKHTIASGCFSPVNLNTTSGYPALKLTARAKARIGQEFLQFDASG